MTMFKSKTSGVQLLSRRHALLCGAGAVVSVAAIASRAVGAPAQIDVTRGNVKPISIALPDFSGAGLPDPAVARGVTQIIASNLQRSGLFAPIDQAAYIEKISNFGAAPRFPDWRQINAQALVTGRLQRLPDGRLGAEFYLWDVFAGQNLDGQKFETPPDNWRRIAHIISDRI